MIKGSIEGVQRILLCLFIKTIVLNKQWSLKRSIIGASLSLTFLKRMTHLSAVCSIYWQHFLLLTENYSSIHILRKLSLVMRGESSRVQSQWLWSWGVFLLKRNWIHILLPSLLHEPSLSRLLLVVNSAYKISTKIIYLLARWWLINRYSKKFFFLQGWYPAGRSPLE